MSGERIGIGLIGLGNSGWHYHAEGTLAGSNDFDLVAVTSARAERREAAAARFDAVAHRDWQGLIADDRVEVVVVATPHHLRESVAVAALAAGKHVVVEKPMAVTTVQARAMLDAAQAHGRILTVFQNRRWEPSFQLIRRLVAEGEVGPVWRVEERRMHGGKYVVAGPDRPHAGSDLATWAHRGGGGGVSYLIAPHLIDHQVVLHGGPPETVSAVMHTYAGDEVEHYLDLRLGFGGGVLSRIEIFRENVLDQPKWAVFGEQGTIICDDFTSLRLQRADGTAQHYGDLMPLQSCDEFYDQLAAAIRGYGPVPVDPGEAAHTVAVLEAAHASARAGGELVHLETVAGGPQ